MNTYFLINSLFCFTQAVFSQSITQNSTIYSTMVKDSFELYISIPAKSDSSKVYDVIYYCDANLKSGIKLRELISSTTYKSKIDHTIFVGVGHIGNLHILRRRDFTLPAVENKNPDENSKTEGRSERFFHFLKSELIPLINSKYKTNTTNNSIIGHSLGGLFVFYCLFKNDSLFKNYFALSPSLWIRHYGIYKFNQLSLSDMNIRNLYFSVGSLEIMNHIKKGTDEMEKFLQQQDFKNIHYYYQIHPGSTHNSQVEKSLKYILNLE